MSPSPGAINRPLMLHHRGKVRISWFCPLHMVYAIYTEPAPYGIYHIYVMSGGVRDVTGGRFVVHCIYMDGPRVGTGSPE